MHGDGVASASGATLLDWIEERCHGVKMQELVHGCIQQGALLTRGMVIYNVIVALV